MLDTILEEDQCILTILLLKAWNAKVEYWEDNTVLGLFHANQGGGSSLSAEF